MGDAAATAQRKFYEKYPNPADWTSSAVHEWVSKAVEKVRLASNSELKKQLPIADPKHTPPFLEQVKSHYETHDESPEMTQEKLWMLATSAMDTSLKIKWLERWNNSHALREALKFPKPKFNDIDFFRWLHKATWWAQVSIYYFFLCFCFFLLLISVFFSLNHTFLLIFGFFMAVGYRDRKTFSCYNC